MADWMTFLEDVAIECGLSPEQKRAFLARFDRANSSRTDKWIVEYTKVDGQQVFAGEAAFTKLMTGIYGAVQQELFPDIAQAAKGKRGKLEKFLKAEFERRSLILGEPEARVPESIAQASGLKLGAPRPRVRLPENFVARSEALQRVKDMLLVESEKPLVVSAIAGLGGLGCMGFWGRVMGWGGMLGLRLVSDSFSLGGKSDGTERIIGDLDYPNGIVQVLVIGVDGFTESWGERYIHCLL